MIGGRVRLLATGWVAEMVGELATQRTLDDRLLEPADRGVELVTTEIGPWQTDWLAEISDETGASGVSGVGDFRCGA